MKGKVVGFVVAIAGIVAMMSGCPPGTFEDSSSTQPPLRYAIYWGSEDTLFCAETDAYEVPARYNGAAIEFIARSVKEDTYYHYAAGRRIVAFSPLIVDLGQQQAAPAAAPPLPAGPE